MGGGFSLAASYAEGIAQPTFFDLYGFFPGISLVIRRLSLKIRAGSKARCAMRGDGWKQNVTGYRQRLHDEIVDNATFTSTINAPGASRRAGLEAELGWTLADKLRLSANYACLHATQPSSSGSGQVRELRRPKHSGSVAMDGTTGKLTYGVSLTYSSAHLDVRDRLPFDVLRLNSYWLAGARVAYALTSNVEIFARAANVLNSRYEDVSGYRTEGRSLYAGLRLSRR